MIKKIRKFKKKFLTRILPRLFYNINLPSVYYFLFDKSFRRENRAVLAGKVKHIDDAERSKANYFLLVRNTHRIEKGLLMRPRRDVFAKEYIAETIDSFEGVWDVNALQTNPQMRWFKDVLDKYFISASADPYINTLYIRFKNKVDNVPDTANIDCIKKSIPYLRLVSDRANIQFEEFYKLTKQRRSIRWFEQKEVSRNLIDKAIEAANQSPSACNRQPFEFKIFDDLDKVKQVVKFPMGTSGYGHSIPVMIVLVGNLDAYYEERDRHVIYIDASLAAMTFMLALETLGLGSCAINWPDIEDRERKMEQYLDLKTYQRPIMCIGVGYPDHDGMVAFSEKRPLSQIRHYNK